MGFEPNLSPSYEDPEFHFTLMWPDLLADPDRQLDCLTTIGPFEFRLRSPDGF